MQIDRQASLSTVCSPIDLIYSVLLPRPYARYAYTALPLPHAVKIMIFIIIMNVTRWVMNHNPSGDALVTPGVIKFWAPRA